MAINLISQSAAFPQVFFSRTNETVTVLCENVMYNLIMCCFFFFQSKKPININHFLPHDTKSYKTLFMVTLTHRVSEHNNNNRNNNNNDGENSFFDLV